MGYKIDYEIILKAWEEQKPTGRKGGKFFWLAIKSAIEKQIAKKPVDEKRFAVGLGLCPRCGELNNSKYNRYCGNCGQKLNWCRKE